MVDKNGTPFIGDKTYKIHIPDKVPAKKYRRVCVYNLETAAFIKDAPVISLDS